MFRMVYIRSSVERRAAVVNDGKIGRIETFICDSRGNRRLPTFVVGGRSAALRVLPRTASTDILLHATTIMRRDDDKQTCDIKMT